ncbi:hypothetical protein [Paraburkholderia caballeronis]|uniref:hypothetical protein n=1 Tax=Paraburkholderia caballeronis TaxID=416943 RepID=UPI001AB0230A|nr:hypothetical protein [Paraburkholderia caballeronis]
MLVNSALEVALHDPDFQKTIADVLVKVEAFFLGCAKAGQKPARYRRGSPRTILRDCCPARIPASACGRCWKGSCGRRSRC